MRRHSPYNYAFNNPVFFIDPDGMAPSDIIIPNKNDRAAIIEMINSRAKGKFDVDENGKLFVVSKEGNKRFSEYYRDKLIDAIESSNTISISISISQKFMLDGVEHDVDVTVGGGLNFV